MRWWIYFVLILVTACNTDDSSSGDGGQPPTNEFDPDAVELFAPFDVTITENPLNNTERAENKVIFMSEGWEGSKAMNLDAAPQSDGAAGKIYTVSASEFETRTGYTGIIPGLNSTRVGKMEALALSVNQQTDFYGGFSEPGNYQKIPADVWFQHWLYVNDNGTEQTNIISGRPTKWLYPCIDGHGSCGADGTAGLWMLHMIGEDNGQYSFALRDATFGISDFTWPNEPDGNQRVLWYNLEPNLRHSTNTWYLFKWHIKTTGTSNGNMFEAWVREIRGNWVKVSEFVSSDDPDNRLPDSSFTWTIDPAYAGNGHDYFRAPTTAPANNVTPYTDLHAYVKDFCIARQEHLLPSYESY